MVGTPQTCWDMHNHPLLDLQSELHGGTKDKLKLSVVRHSQIKILMNTNEAMTYTYTYIQLFTYLPTYLPTYLLFTHSLTHSRTHELYLRQFFQRWLYFNDTTEA